MKLNITSFLKFQVLKLLKNGHRRGEIVDILNSINPNYAFITKENVSVIKYRDRFRFKKELNFRKSLDKRTKALDTNLQYIDVTWGWYRYRRSKIVPELSEEQKQKRLAWCYENRFNNFENYVFIDEKKIKLNLNPLNTHRKKSSCPPCTGVKSRNQGCLNVWGVISLEGATPFVAFTNNLNRFGYQEIIYNYIFPFCQEKYNFDCIVHQDNDTKHRSRLCQQTYRDLNIYTIKAPANSPDLNSIEMVWSSLKTHLRRRLCRDAEEAKLAIKEFCENELSKDKIAPYIERIFKSSLKKEENGATGSDEKKNFEYKIECQ
ncbi:unnamed protein product, partial [Brachionus calyciflorus]